LKDGELNHARLIRFEQWNVCDSHFDAVAYDRLRFDVERWTCAYILEAKGCEREGLTESNFDGGHVESYDGLDAVLILILSRFPQQERLSRVYDQHQQPHESGDCGHGRSDIAKPLEFNV
jgi:hypothetical protein